MNVDSLGPIGSLAGSSMSEARLADAIRARTAASRPKAVAGSRSADDTPGVRQTSGGEEIGDDDSGTRGFWDLPDPCRPEANLHAVKPENAEDGIGRHVDLSG